MQIESTGHTAMHIVGLELEEARARLAAAGARVGTVAETAPPFPVELRGPWRVVRVRLHDAGADLVVTREHYIPRGA